MMPWLKQILGNQSVTFVDVIKKQRNSVINPGRKVGQMNRKLFLQVHTLSLFALDYLIDRFGVQSTLQPVDFPGKVQGFINPYATVREGSAGSRKQGA